MEPFKEAQRATWSAGDYADLAGEIAEAGQLLVERSGVEQGMRVLDVGCGTGNATLPAARAGAAATGLDLTPKLLEQGREEADAAGLEIEWVEGDAEDLPFEDGSFDRVLSTFGHMFAPRHRRAAEEMTRACAAGGAVAVCCWTPEGTAGRMLRAGAPFMPPPPDFASPPILWGTEDHVKEMFGAVATDFEFERHSVIIEADSLEAWVARFTHKFGPLVKARERLGDRFGEMLDATIEVWEDANEADDGRLRFPQEYLLSIVRL